MPMFNHALVWDSLSFNIRYLPLELHEVVAELALFFVHGIKLELKALHQLVSILRDFAQRGRKRVILLGLPGQHYMYLMEAFVPCLQEPI